MKHDNRENDETPFWLISSAAEREYLGGLGCSDEQIDAIIDYYRKELSTRVSLVASSAVLAGLVCLFFALAMVLLRL